MTAYILFTLESISDPDAWQRYRQAARPSLGQYGGRILAGPEVIELLEGEPLSDAVIVAFDDVAAAQAWYRSPEYQSALPIRQSGTTGRALILAGRD